MTVLNRKDARDDLVSKMTASMTGLQAVYDHRPPDFFGESPVASVESGFSDPALRFDEGENMFGLLVTIFVKRDDPNIAEDVLDDLDFAFRSFMKTWNNGEFAQESEIAPETIKGTQYLRERHFIQVDWDGV